MATTRRASSSVQSSCTLPSSLPYKIEQAQSPPLRINISSPYVIVLHILTCSLWASYLFKRFALSYSAPTSSWQLWALTFVELGFHIPEATSNAWTLLAMASARNWRPRPSYKLVGDEAPTIDVLITVCGEDVETIMDTIAGASSQDYPIGSYRVFVLDDGKDAALEESIREFNKNQSRSNRKTVTYMARDKPAGKPHHFKAGNLRYGIDTTESLNGGSEYIAALDADLIPEHDLLSRVVPHLILDRGLALASTPQHFYNVLEPDVLSQDSHVFGGGLEPLNDAMGCSHCSGSGYILRRAALKSSGGWPLVNVGEDIYCSNDLLGKGWRTAYIDEDLQYGLAPPSIHAYFKQRIRWTDGTLIILRDFRFYIPSLDRGTRSITQRLNGMINAVKTYSSVPITCAALLLPSLVLPTQSKSTSFTALEQDLLFCNTILILAIAFGKISTYFIWGKIGTKSLSAQKNNRFWVAPYSAYCIIRQFFPGHKITFTTTGSIISSANERSAKHRQPLPGRLLSPPMLGYILFIVCGATAFWSRVGVTVLSRVQGGPAYQFPFPGAMSRLNESILRIWVLVGYMIWPQDVPERRELLQYEGHGVYRPKSRKRPVPQNSLGRNDLIEISILLMFTLL